MCSKLGIEVDKLALEILMVDAPTCSGNTRGGMYLNWYLFENEFSSGSKQTNLRIKWNNFYMYTVSGSQDCQGLPLPNAGYNSSSLSLVLRKASP